MNDNRTSKRKIPSRSSFNAIDVAILLLVIACVLGLYLRYSAENEMSYGADDSYTVEFVCEHVRYTTADYIHLGDKIYFKGGSTAIGEVDGTLVNIPSSDIIYVDGEMREIRYSSDTIIDIKGSVRMNGVMTENGFLVGGNTYIAPNSVIHVSNKYADFEMKIVSITKNDAANEAE